MAIGKARMGWAYGGLPEGFLQRGQTQFTERPFTPRGAGQQSAEGRVHYHHRRGQGVKPPRADDVPVVYTRLKFGAAAKKREKPSLVAGSADCFPHLIA